MKKVILEVPGLNLDVSNIIDKAIKERQNIRNKEIDDFLGPIMGLFRYLPRFITKRLFSIHIIKEGRGEHFTVYFLGKNKGSKFIFY